jgi:transposase
MPTSLDAAPVGRVWNRAGTSRDDQRALTPRGYTQISCLPCHRPSWNPSGPGVRAAAQPPSPPPVGLPPPRIPDRIIFDKLIQVLVLGCAYRRIAEASCSATTLCRRRHDWIAAGVAEQLHLAVLAAYERLFRLESEHLAVDWVHHQGAPRRPGPRAKSGGSSQAGAERSLVTEATGIPLAVLAAPANRRDDGLLTATLDALGLLGPLPSARWCTWTPATTGRPADRSWPSAGWLARSPPAGSRPRCRQAAGG